MNTSMSHETACRCLKVERMTAKAIAITAEKLGCDTPFGEVIALAAAAVKRMDAEGFNRLSRQSGHGRVASDLTRQAVVEKIEQLAAAVGLRESEVS